MEHGKASTALRTPPPPAGGTRPLSGGPARPEDWIARLRRRLDPADGPQSGAGAVLRPPGAPDEPSAARAAVLAPLILKGGELHIILTVRPRTMTLHAGQVCLPGGRIQADDEGPAACALRETREEIGLDPARIELLGRWEPCLTGTGFLVTPFAGLVDPDASLRACPREVETIFTAPLEFLMDPSNHREDEAVFAGQRRRFTVMRFGDYDIWGATAAMLRALSARLAAPDADADHGDRG